MIEFVFIQNFFSYGIYLYKLVGTLALHCLCLLALCIQDGELELGPHLALVAAHEQQVERKVFLSTNIIFLETPARIGLHHF